MTVRTAVARRPVGDGLFIGSLDAPDTLRLLGMRCRECAVVSFGFSHLCPNCGADEPDQIPLSREGTLATFSILRHRPPGAYRGPEPFEPFAVGLVSLPEGVSVVSPLRAGIGDVAIGMDLRLEPHILYESADGAEVIAFRFAPDPQKRPG